MHLQLITLLLHVQPLLKTAAQCFSSLDGCATLIAVAPAHCCFSCVCLHQLPLRFKPVFFFVRRPSWTRPCLLLWITECESDGLWVFGRVTWPFLLLDFPEPIPPHIVYISSCCVNKLRCYFKIFQSCARVRSFMLDTDGHMDACFRQQYVVTSKSTYKYTGAREVWIYMNNVGLQINRVHDDYKHACIWSVLAGWVTVLRSVCCWVPLLVRLGLANYTVILELR